MLTARAGRVFRPFWFSNAWDLTQQPNNNGYHYYSSLVTVSNDPGGNCIYADPKFVDMVNYRLKCDVATMDISPCVDKAHNPGPEPYDTVPAADRDENPRPVDICDTYVPDFGGGHNPDAYCDMGCYEVQGPTCP